MKKLILVIVSLLALNGCAALQDMTTGWFDETRAETLLEAEAKIYESYAEILNDGETILTPEQRASYQQHRTKLDQAFVAADRALSKNDYGAFSDASDNIRTSLLELRKTIMEAAGEELRKRLAGALDPGSSIGARFIGTG